MRFHGLYNFKFACAKTHFSRLLLTYNSSGMSLSLFPHCPVLTASLLLLCCSPNRSWRVISIGLFLFSFMTFLYNGLLIKDYANSLTNTGHRKGSGICGYARHKCYISERPDAAKEPYLYSTLKGTLLQRF